MQLFRVNVPASGSVNSHKDVHITISKQCYKIKKTTIFGFGQL